jgi:preprotein translocase subunit SecY
MLDLTAKTRKKRSNPREKVLLTLFVIFIFRFGNALPLSGIDQEALKKSFLQMENRNAIMQIINMYSGGGTSVLTPFSLGIIPFINASILVDLLTAIVPFLEKLQSEEGEAGRKQLTFYKKVLTLIFAIIQSGFLIFYLKSYFYNTELVNLGLVGLELVTGSMFIVWLTNIIDNKGIGNGTSIIILTNIIVTFLSKDLISVSNFDGKTIFEIGFILLLLMVIAISQTARFNIDVVSARQLAYLEAVRKGKLNAQQEARSKIKGNGLSIRLNQAGIFPIIIASNLIPLTSYLTDSLFGPVKFLNTLIYYLLIIGFNYFYTIVFWDPEKISEQLRKASVSIVDVTPGRETVSYLENVVRSTSILGGISLCGILVLYDVVKQLINGNLLNQVNISSLIIVAGVSYEIQRTIRSLFKNELEDSN